MKYNMERQGDRNMRTEAVNEVPKSWHSVPSNKKIQIIVHLLDSRCILPIEMNETCVWLC